MARVPFRARAFSSEATMAKAKKTIVIKHPGALTRKAKTAGMSVTKFTNAVLKKGKTDPAQEV